MRRRSLGWFRFRLQRPKIEIHRFVPHLALNTTSFVLFLLPSTTPFVGFGTSNVAKDDDDDDATITMSDAGGDEKKDSPSGDESSVLGLDQKVRHTDHGCSRTSSSTAATPQLTFLRLESATTTSSNGHRRSLSQEQQVEPWETVSDHNNLTASLLLPQHLSTSSSTSPPPPPPPLRWIDSSNIPFLQHLERRYLTRENRIQARRFIRKFGDYLGSLSLLTMLVVVPTVLYRALSNRELDRAAYRSSVVMVVGTIVLSVRLVYLHLTHWYMPDVQKYIVRILWMVCLLLLLLLLLLLSINRACVCVTVLN